MVAFMLFVLQLIFLAQPISCEFTNPATQNEILILGQPIRVTYRGIDYKNYTIALWQQLPQGGGAILGPALYVTTDGGSKSFDWVVQLYGFDLDYSDKFFFWLFQGDYSNQGHPDQAKHMVSGYFIISKASPSTASSSASATPTPTATSQQTTATSQETSTSAPSNSKGISTGAKASIAVGAVGGAIAIIGAAAFFVRYRTRKSREMQKASGWSGGNHLYPPSYGSPPAPGAELYYKSHGVASFAPHNDMPRDHGFSGQPIAHARHLNQAPVEMGA
ncbi:hypothetical protein BBO_07130 [Beauveria brongniartii RCEF 3172]|uniref:Uncharacterized protein n=1 Tax=Beauveria brongniartii RCEF 3172 TaxID=1081107 RepID=A0A167A2T4_9HYPO|nr:hypothetical protein BBO_07130 [Beauveria brongniartii RCEF 3172]